MSNYFDQISIDIDYIYEKFPFWKRDYKVSQNDNLNYKNRTIFNRFYETRLVPLVVRRIFRRIFRQSQIDINWISIFNSYWTSVLKGRPLWSIHDFFFLKNTYRLKFQNLNILDDVNSKEHLVCWQKPETVYQLFHLASKESLSDEVELLKLMKKFSRKAKTILEFGAGTAPIATTWQQLYYPRKNYKWIIADIKTVAFHYACYKFRNNSEIVPLLLTPEKIFLPPDYLRVDVIFCKTVFEHLQNPLEVVVRLYEILSPNGVLIFDYIKSDGTGLDTIKAVRERKLVLKFIGSKFKIVYGNIDNGQTESMGLTIAKKISDYP